MPLVSFSPGQVISSANVNANFGLCMLTDTSRTVSVTHTYTASQTFTGGWTAAAGCTVSAGGIAVTGNSSVTGTLGVSSTLTASSGLAVTGTITLGTASAKIIPGTAQVSFRNNADSQDNLIITDGGAVTVRAGITVASGGLTVSAGTSALQAVTGTTGSFSGTMTVNQLNPFSVGTFKILGGSTATAFRNNADSANNLNITDAGIISTRGGFSINAAGAVLLVAGTTTVVPINFPAGTAPTSPTDGDLWYDGTNLKFRQGITTKTVTLA